MKSSLLSSTETAQNWISVFYLQDETPPTWGVCGGREEACWDLVCRVDDYDNDEDDDKEECREAAVCLVPEICETRKMK